MQRARMLVVGFVFTAFLLEPIPGAGRAAAQVAAPEPEAGEDEEAGQPAAGEDAAETAPAAEPGAAPSRRRAVAIEEIVVTARKREESLLDTPVSVTALGDAALVDAGVKRLDQIENLVPNLTFQTGDGLTASVYIRGVGQASALATFDPGVGIYVDGVYLARAQGSVLDVIDVEQIEVLRGPQGTLFGRNTAGGAINIRTRKPHDEFEADLMLRHGDRNRWDSRGIVNVPLSFGPFEDKLFARLGFASADDNGYSRDQVRGEKYNERGMRSGTAALRYVPTEDFTIDLAGSYTYEETTGRGTQCVQVLDETELDTFSRLLLQALEAEKGEDYLEECRQRSDPLRFERDEDLDPLERLESYGASITLDYDLGSPAAFDSLTVKSITSWREQKTHDRSDTDGTAIFVGIGAAAGEGEQKEDLAFGGVDFDGEGGDYTQYSQEFQLNGSAFDGALNFVTGLYSFYETSKVIDARRFFPEILAIFGNPAMGIGASDCGGGAAENETGTRNWSYAFFGQATWDATDWLSLTGGLRRTKEYKRFQRVIINPFNPFCPEFNRTAETALVLDEDVDERYDSWTPMAQVAFTLPDDLVDGTPVDHAMIYFSYAQGFKSGGFNGGVLGNAEGEDDVAKEESLTPFDEEKVDSYEIGFKTTWWERRVNLNASFFFMDYTDLQVNTIEALPGSGQLGNFLNVVRNAAEAEVLGLEIELQARPAEGWYLTFSGGIQDTEFLEFEDGSSQLVAQAVGGSGGPCTQTPTCDRSGESFNNVPKYQVSASLQYSFQVDPGGPDWFDGWITPRVEGYWQSRTHMTGPEVRELRQDDYALLHARLSYDLNDDRTQIALWGRNLTDKRYFTFGFATVTSLATAQRYFAMPRSYGIEVRHKF